MSFIDLHKRAYAYKEEGGVKAIAYALRIVGGGGVEIFRFFAYILYGQP